MVNKNIFKDGKIKTIYGKPQAGMTNCSVYLLEKLIAEGYNITDNIEWKKEK